MTTTAIEAPEVELTEFEEIDVQKVSGVAAGANGFPHLMLKGIAVKADAEPHGAFTGTHDHDHPAFGGPDGDGDGVHDHKHSHDGDADHHHQHGAGKAIVNGKVDQKPDISLGEKILALLGQAMGNESQEVAAGHHGEAGDVHMLAQAHDIVHQWCNGEKTHPDGLKSAGEDDAEKAKLTAASRDNLPDSAFAIPETRSYPIHDENHAHAALSEVAQHGTPEEKAKVRAAVRRRYPDIKVEDDSDSSKSVVAEGETTVEDVTQGNDDLTKAVETAVAKAVQPYEERITTLGADLAKAQAKADAAEATVKAWASKPIPGGPVLSGNARPQAETRTNDEAAAKARYYEEMASTVASPQDADGYRQLAAQAKAQLTAPA